VDQEARQLALEFMARHPMAVASLRP
jgi:hypothetical protein